MQTECPFLKPAKVCVLILIGNPFKLVTVCYEYTFRIGNTSSFAHIWQESALGWKLYQVPNNATPLCTVLSLKGFNLAMRQWPESASELVYEAYVHTCSVLKLADAAPGIEIDALP